MKTKNAASRPIPTAAQLKTACPLVTRNILRIPLVLSTIPFTHLLGLDWLDQPVEPAQLAHVLCGLRADAAGVRVC
ncbi:MAG: hypothetical protein ACLVK8_00585 [Ruminococcus sp.]